MPKAVIFGGIAGARLSDAERRFYRAVDPVGFILFARNVETPGQVQALTASLTDLMGRELPILLDQEGGRVQRLRPPHWRAAPPARVFGRLAERDLAGARRAVYLNHRLLAAEQAALGITVDCAPVLDLGHAGAHAVIGDRAFGSDAILVADLGRAAMEGLHDGGVQAVVKHAPGHGRALVDSHHALPVCDTDFDTLAATDFLPFRLLRDAPWMMTAHVVYSALDRENAATTSRRVLQEVIRGHMGFDGLIVSDDLSMKALSGTLAARAERSLRAGCDLLLHCNAGVDEMAEVAHATAELTPDAARRLAAAARRPNRRPEPPEQLLAALDGLLATA
ncbi:MAG TPA: beta-N-acetylhexosaminidase [Kiloniellales bacterium]|nr:beta-N-acetylhexosaminidase [Kiloniellales bacterium]